MLSILLPSPIFRPPGGMCRAGWEGGGRRAESLSSKLMFVSLICLGIELRKFDGSAESSLNDKFSSSQMLIEEALADVGEALECSKQFAFISNRARSSP